jgi:hypothetical protein
LRLSSRTLYANFHEIQDSSATKSKQLRSEPNKGDTLESVL